jgi:hypothetical protein
MSRCRTASPTDPIITNWGYRSLTKTPWLRTLAGVSDDFAVAAYVEFRDYPAWDVVDRAINALTENQDIDETTVHELIVGYIVKSLAEAGLLTK